MRKAFICPTKYVQGEDELLNLGYFVKTFGDSALLIAHEMDVERVKAKLDATAEKFGVTFVPSNFGGECSRQEIARLQAVAKENGCACTIGLGGGKAIDTAKCVAQGEALIICPTIAATDAPTSHSAVMYTPDGAFDDYAYFKQSPSVVMIDTTVVAAAPTRFLVSGMGDALATYFEARATARANANVNAGLPCGFREGFWVWRQCCDQILRLGTLEFEYLPELSEREVALTGMKPHAPILSVHIPCGCDTSREALNASYAMARTYFAERPYLCYANGVAPQGIVCHTWLLSTALKTLLKETSGIRRFMEDYEIVHHEEEGKDCIHFLFRVASDTPFENLPEDTSLRRDVKAYLLSGKGIGTGYGVLKNG